MTPLEMSLRDLRAAIERGELDPGAVVAASLERIEAIDYRFNAFSEFRSAARDEARPDGPLAGVPIGVKDLLVDGGRHPMAGSKVHADWLSGTAEAVRRLRAAGAAVVGYTNLHEWGVGTTSAITSTGPISNPRARDRIAGGSSGGSAAAVAAGMVTAAIGTDAGGSIRIPAACCGISGFKPTHGRVPTEGFTGHGGGIDHIGPMGRNVSDVRALFEVLAGTPTLSVDVKQLRVGVAREHFFGHVDAEVEAVLADALAQLTGVVDG
ncbi:MAG: amidase, partial [Actinomycetota bacterium]|nr:amidase [Actinomycetota bacterium]